MSRKMLNRGALTLLQHLAAGGQPERVELDPSRYKNYGEVGGEHVFFPGRTLPPVGTFAKPSGLPPPPKTNPKGGIGDYIPLLGLGAIVGKDLYKKWQARNPGQTLTPEIAASLDAQARDTSSMDAYANQNIEDFTNNLPMPHLNDDGSISHLGETDQFWNRMDAQARDVPTQSDDEFVNEYNKTHEMPTAEYDPGLLSRGIQGGGGALDLYIGSQQGGIGGAGKALSGAGKLGDAIGYGGDTTKLLGTAGGALSGVNNIYGGIQQGGVEGYGRAAVGALQTGSKLGLVSGGAGAALGKAVPIVNAAISAYGAYESAAVGDKKGAVTQGAIAGASIGSVIPVVGTVVGAAIGAVVGLIGASLGNKEMPSEQFYGAYKKLDPSASVRGWTDDQVNGAVFETIKSHTKSGNINKFKDVAEMYSAFGINKDAHKNYRTVQNDMSEFIKGTIETAQKMGALPKDVEALRQIDGQELYHRIIVPAMAAKYKEATGKDSVGWTTDHSTGDSTLQNLFADWTDHTLAHWGEVAPTVNSGGSASGMKRGKFQQKARGGLSTMSEGRMLPRRGGLSRAMAPRPQVDDSSTYYHYGAPPQQQPQPPMPMGGPPAMQPRMGVPARPMPPMMRSMGGLSAYGYQTGGAQRLVKGPGTGRSDDIPARLSDGEYVFDAETVALLGDGSTDEGARRLDALRAKLRMQKGQQLSKGKFSSAAKQPEEYLE